MWRSVLLCCLFRAGLKFAIIKSEKLKRGMRRIIKGDQEKVTMRQKKIRGVWYPGNQILLLSIAAQQDTPKRNGLKKQQSFILLINLQCGQGSVGTCHLCSFSVSQGDSSRPRTQTACSASAGSPASESYLYLGSVPRFTKDK